MKSVKILVWSLILVLGLASGKSWADDAGQQIIIKDAWVKALPPSVKNTAVYMEITNQSDEEIKLLSVESDVAEVNEIHIMSIEKGRMTMAQIKEVAVEPHASVTLEPGGIHIMLIGLKNPIVAGDEVKLVLHFDGGVDKTVVAIAKHPMDVKSLDKENHEHHHDHGSMHE